MLSDASTLLLSSLVGLPKSRKKCWNAAAAVEMCTLVLTRSPLGRQSLARRPPDPVVLPSGLPPPVNCPIRKNRKKFRVPTTESPVPPLPPPPEGSRTRVPSTAISTASTLVDWVGDCVGSSCMRRSKNPRRTIRQIRDSVTNNAVQKTKRCSCNQLDTATKTRHYYHRLGCPFARTGCRRHLFLDGRS